MAKSISKSDSFLPTDPSSFLQSNEAKQITSHTKYGSVERDAHLLGYESKNKCSKLFRFVTSLKIEPAMFLYVSAYMMNMSVDANIIMEKACIYHFRYSYETCINITQNQYHEEKTSLEKLANNYILYANILSLIAGIVMMFVAPWSDKYGRKLPLVIAIFGTIVTDVLYILWVVYFQTPASYYLLLKIPIQVSGGFICFVTIVYSHAADVSSEKYRTLKYTTVEIAMTLAFSIGGLAGGVIYKFFGYFYVYLTSTVLHVLTLQWVVFVVEETIGLDEVVAWRLKARNLFRLESVSKSLKATIRPRKNQGRIKIWMYFFSICVFVMTYQVYNGLGYIYAYHIYNWDPSKYNIVTTTFNLIYFATLCIVVPLFVKFFKMSDPVLGMIGTISMLVKNFVLAFAKYNTSIYYLANSIGFMSGLTTLAIRTGLSKIAEKNELGLIFSFLAICEQVFPMIGLILMTGVFNATIDVFPSVAYLMASTFLLFPLFTFVWVYRKLKAKRQSIFQAECCSSKHDG